jgi:solute carrier family 25 carnitine/acylcarnitine transporter 20/29
VQLNNLDCNLAAECGMRRLRWRSHEREDFLCGWIGGASGVAFSHPLDTIRVQCQVDAKTSISQSIRTTFAREGLTGFAKGIMSPMVSIGLWKSSIFGVHAHVIRYFQKGDTKLKLSLWQQAFASSIGGFAGAFINCPIETAKCNAQASDLRP